MDVYEHAYFLDFATGRKAYIDAFFKNIDWGFVGGVIEKYKL
jgi:superoxide dismutase, Fe-Mn family